MLVQRVDEIHFVLIQQAEHFLRAGRDDFQRDIRKLPAERLKAVPEEPVAQRISHGDPDMPPERTGIVGHARDFVGERRDLVSEAEYFAAFRRQFDGVIDPVEKGKTQRFFQLSDLKKRRWTVNNPAFRRLS